MVIECVSLGPLAIPLGHPEAMVWIIRVQAIELTHLSERKRAHQLTAAPCF